MPIPYYYTYPCRLVKLDLVTGEQQTLTELLDSYDASRWQHKVWQIEQNPRFRVFNEGTNSQYNGQYNGQAGKT